MSMMIILTEQQATQVNGMYGKYNRLEAGKLDDGRYVLTATVLDSSIFESVHELLRSCPIEEFLPEPHGYEHIADRDELKAWINDNGLAEHFDLRKSLQSLKTALDEYFGV